MPKSLRLTISKHHEIYLNSIASQMGVNNTSEALNYLLWELRRQNYSFGSQAQCFDPTTYETQPTVMSGLSFIPQSPQAIQEFEDLREEIDPVIQRLINAGLEMNF
ncbi:hypothetical protein H6G41_32460 [Tolypothrix sp. FACHB-123]|uniref:hypothetical protein n=1 Tax=Tolypothrix sp. FACHB-123 TaxID=2692868 RepID=UPI001682AF23|nr:hypothetical protein [Tolypothrix sp. FACHB-123]MBD2359245.1 hypothetical protein [Tolypothrix sp. FACHB-123]